MRRIECRVMAGAGAVLSVIGVLLSAFVTDIWQLILTYSVIAGMMHIYCPKAFCDHPRVTKSLEVVFPKNRTAPILDHLEDCQSFKFCCQMN